MTLVCAGRPVSRFDNQATGDPCGATYPGPVDSARVAGWRVGDPDRTGGRPAMCPVCASPRAGDESPGIPVLEPIPGL